MTQTQIHTLEEYLDLELHADTKSEFYAGAIYAMSGGTGHHSRLSSRMNVLLERYLQDCEIFDSSMKLYVKSAQSCVYPDTMAVCGNNAQYLQSRKDVLVNPSVIVEVLSPSSESYDRGVKSAQTAGSGTEQKKDSADLAASSESVVREFIKTDYYRNVESVRDILLILQDARLVEHFKRMEKGWSITPHLTGERITLITRNCLIPVDEIYRNILAE